MSADVAYVDASALVKLLRPETESAALRRFLGAVETVASSRVVQVEIACAARRTGSPPALVRALVEGIDLLALDDAVLDGAQREFEPPQRALDAIHLATADRHRGEIDVFVTYDADQAAAARSLGLPVLGPA